METETIHNNIFEETEEERRLRDRKRKLRKLHEAHLPYQFVMLLVLAFIFVPLYIVLITSLTSEIESSNAAFSWWPKLGLTLEGYIQVFTRKMGGISLLGSFINTMWIYLPSTIVGIFMSAMAAFSFAKLDFKLNKPAFALLMTGMTLPNCMSTISSFLIFDNIGWVNTPLPMMVPRMLGTVGVVFFLRQFYMGIPNDLIGAGRVDGLGEIGVFFYIMLPISIPALISQFILQFIGGYNDYLAPLLYLQDANMYTLQIALAFFTEAYVQNWTLRMAGCFVAMTPLLILYLISQRYMLKGVAISSGLKG